MAGQNHKGTCLHCTEQHHRDLNIKHWQDNKTVSVPRQEIEKVLKLNIDDDIREIIGGWLK